MIEAVIWILLFVMSGVLGTCLIVLFYKPEEEKKTLQPIHAIHPKQEEEAVLTSFGSTDYESRAEAMEREIALRWPETMVTLKPVRLPHALLLDWTGLAKEGDHIIFHVTNHDAGTSLLQAVAEFSESNLIPIRNFHIVLPYNRTDTDMIDAEVKQVLTERKITAAFVLTDGSCLTNLPETKGTAAIIGTGLKLYSIYRVYDNSYDYEWSGELDDSLIFRPQWSECAAQSIRSISSILPKRIRLELHLPFMKDKAMRDIMQVLPKSKSWFLPVLDKQGDNFRLYAANAEQLKEAEKVLEDHASTRKIKLEKTDHFAGTVPVSDQEADFRMITDALRESLVASYIVPALIEPDTEDGMYPGMKVLCFAPLFQKRRTSWEGATAFYRNLLTGKQRKY